MSLICMETTGGTCHGFDLNGDHQSTNPKGNGQSIMIVRAITDKGPVISDDRGNGRKREGFP